MRIALVGAEFEENLAVRYLRGALEAAGHEVIQIVFNDPQDTEWAAQAVAAVDAELVGFSMVFTARAREFAAVATRARALGCRAHLVAGGHFAAFNAHDLLRAVPALDSVAIGEGEGILCALAAAGAAPATVRGLVWRDAERLVENPPAPNPPDLDELASPPHKQPPDRYLGLPIVNLLGSRGCTHACSFCSIAAWHRRCGGPRLRLRDPERIADEMAALYRAGARLFNFHDDNFVLDDPAAMIERADALARALEARQVGAIAFAVKCRPDAADPRVLARLRAMGLFRVFLGIEAGTDAALGQLGRGQTVAENERALQVVRDLDLHAAYNLLLLNPDSTLEDVAGNVAFLRRHAHHPTNFCRTEVYAGTPLERRLRAAGRLVGDLWGYDYRIADPRAEAAFEVIRVAFAERNYGAECLHHLAMSLDYEVHLLERFFGRAPALRRAADRLVVAINRNTADHLDALVDALRAGVPTPGALAELTARTAAAIAADDRRLAAEARALLVRIREAAARRVEHPSWLRTATAAGLAAALAVSAGCRDRTGGSHPTETVARPTEPDSGLGQSHVSEMVAAPPSVITLPHDPRFSAPDASAGPDVLAAPTAGDGGVPGLPPRPTHVHEMAPRPDSTWRANERRPKPEE